MKIKMWRWDKADKKVPITNKDEIRFAGGCGQTIYNLSLFAFDACNWSVYLWAYDVLWGCIPLPGTDIFIDVDL